jgi:hypothetical protein
VVAKLPSSTADVNNGPKLELVEDGVKRGVLDEALLWFAELLSSTAGVDDGLMLGAADDGVRPGVPDVVLLALDASPFSMNGVDDNLKLGVAVDGVKRGISDTVLLEPGEPPANRDGAVDGVKKRGVPDALLLGLGEPRSDPAWLSARYDGEKILPFPKGNAVEGGVEIAALEFELIDPAGVRCGIAGLRPCSRFGRYPKTLPQFPELGDIKRTYPCHHDLEAAARIVLLVYLDMKKKREL